MKTYSPSEVDLPDIFTIERHLLLLLHSRSRAVPPKELYGPVAEMLGLGQLQLNARRRTRDERAWNNRVQTARKHLVDRGLLDPSRRGFWNLTPAGRLQAEKYRSFNPEELGL